MRFRHGSFALTLTLASASAASLATTAGAQAAESTSITRADHSAPVGSALPFAPGEKLTLRGKVHTGVSGGGTLWIEGPVEVRGTPTWLLHSDMEGRVGPLRATDRNASWLDPVRMTSLRYTARERHIVSRHDDAVDIFGSEKRWRSENGAEGATSTALPLDELSFLYFVRTLPLVVDTVITAARHYDPARNPTVVRITGREEVEVGAGRFRAVVLEMRVRDPRRYKGEGVIRIHLSDDSCRLILRLDSRVPEAGPATLELQSYEGVRAQCSARVDG